jgi:hypothetical protein
VYPYITYAIGTEWSGYPVKKTEAQRKKEAQRFQYPYTKEEKEENALAIEAEEKEEEEALQEEEALAILLKENEQEVLQDGYEVEVTQQGQRLRRRSSRFESRPLF